MATLLGPPDVEALVVVALKAGLAAPAPGLPVGTKVANPRPKEFIRIELFGGTEETIISDNCSIYLEAWAATAARAAVLLQLARAVLKDQHGVLFGVTTIGAPSHSPDPTTAQERYRALMGVRVRYSALT
ncbi:hypothetical protein C3B59_10455 [Cryobacterium zongtaii]|uniref:DUF3168 domain-containing protein n=1 Tax=Cryobacterium zongtaii TaxID=1259217 RepID=A0A2S3ZCH6_9MICO|nr:hypothetical protein [Cryobacterium zongtaii]POH63956.1 hypothetical protein C3B59_10455 [Cryobacterium zongtaii]